VDAVDDDWDRFADFAEYDAFTREWLSGCRRVLKDDGTIWVIGSYHNIYRVGAILMDLGFWILNDIVWVKANPMPNFRGVRFANAHETLIWAKKSPGQKRYSFNYAAMKEMNDGKQMRSDWSIPLCAGKERLRKNGEKVHATQKPEELLHRVLMASSRPGDLALDPFFGTGTTGAVAKRLGRRYLGIERESRYVEEATRRIAGITAAPEESLVLPAGKRSLPRVAFGSLVARGWIRPGDRLYLDGKREQTGVVMSDGSVKVGEFRGSIHAAGARLLNHIACNGWERWRIEDETGEMVLLDVLRERARNEAERNPECGEETAREEGGG
jgi:modification methylase